VRRNSHRFPSDFMFVLADNEVSAMVSQNVIPGLGKLGGARPMAFTEQGVAMLIHIKEDALPYRTKRKATS
jgi:urocanate hydratase